MKIFCFIILHSKLWSLQNHYVLNLFNRFVRVSDGIWWSVSFGTEKYDAIYNRITYFISQKNGFTYVFSHNHARIKIYSYDSLPLKTFTLYSAIILIKSAFNED